MILQVLPAATETAQDESFWGTVLTVALIVVSAAILHLVIARMIRTSVQRWIKSGRSREDNLVDNPEQTVELQVMIMSQRREQRARAVGQMLRNFLALAIWGTAVMLVLTEIGVNIAPIIASAGVASVALGFGAQTLVKDYLSGFFLIVEDQYGVGDLVDLGSAIGTVEEVALRCTRLRDANGVVWYVRNGEILRVANQSQGWTMATAIMPVSYDADLEEIRQIVGEVGADMHNDPVTQEMALGRPVFSGVDSVSGEAMYVRFSCKARASQQMVLTRELRERLKKAFDEHGVVVPMIARPLQYGADGVPLPPGTAPAATPPR